MIIRPFRALRPEKNVAARVASPPYDVLSSDEAREMVRSNPLSFLRVNKPEVDFSSDVQPGTAEVQQQGKKNLNRLIADGTLFQDERPGLYIYRLTWQGKSQTGIVVTSSVAEYDEGKIKKHEKTRPAKVSDRADHIETVGAQVGPVFSIYRHHSSIRGLLESLINHPAEYDFQTPDGVHHQLWVVHSAERIDALREEFNSVDELYIADGHHRSEAASEVCRRRQKTGLDESGDEGYNYFLNVLFPDDELRILPYNRVVRGLNGLSPNELLSRMKEKASLSDSSAAVAPDRPGVFGLYLNGQWHRVELPEGRKANLGPADRIDSAILTEDILEPVLGISDIRTDDRIDFVGGIRGLAELEKLVRSGPFDVAFSLYPVTVEELLAVADAREVMPPKSTWFEPKLRSGLFIHKLDD